MANLDELLGRLDAEETLQLMEHAWSYLSEEQQIEFVAHHQKTIRDLLPEEDD